MKIIRVISGSLLIAERTLMIILLAVMIVLAFAQVILRNMFSSGLLWGDTLLRQLVLWIGFLGASLATQQEKHITIDILSRFCSPKVVHIVHIVTNIFAGVVCYYLASAGMTFLLSEWEEHETLLTIGAVEFRTWWFQTIIPAGFGLMAFRFLLRAAEHIIEIFQPSGKTPFSSNVPTIDI